MLTCSCGSVLVSDGTTFRCPWASDKNYHTKPPVDLADLRVTTIDGQARIKGKKIGRLINV